MAPTIPEEVDVFTIPHSRMKGLVQEYFDLLKSTNFCNDLDMDVLLQNLLKTFMEFKTHEQIENRYIMKKLKIKLKRLSIQNTAVCNCHKDDQLGQMMRFIKDGYKKKTEQDRMNFARKLREELETFTRTFIPHMQEEEDVFQPLLLQYFSYDELCDLKKKVIQQHLIQEQIRSLGLEKYVVEDARDFTTSSSSSDEDEKSEVVESVAKKSSVEEKPQKKIDDLPLELLSRIFEYMSPKDLAHCSQVCFHWNHLALQPFLWRNIFPVQWAQGNWSCSEPKDDEEDEFSGSDDEHNPVMDDDADVDEAATEPYSDRLLQMKQEAKVLMGVAKHLLPRVGTGVHRLSLANSQALSNGLLNKMLQQCPNLEHLNLTQTRVGDAGFKNIDKTNLGRSLKTLVLSGCVNISDATLVRLSMSQHKKIQHTNEDVSAVNERVPGNKNECLCEKYQDQYGVKLEGGCNVVESWNNRCCNEYRAEEDNEKNCEVNEDKDEGDEKSHSKSHGKKNEKKNKNAHYDKNKKTLPDNDRCTCACNQSERQCDKNSSSMRNDNNYNAFYCKNNTETCSNNDSSNCSCDSPEGQVAFVNDRQVSPTAQHNTCHSCCEVTNENSSHSSRGASATSTLRSWSSIEDCASPSRPSKPENVKKKTSNNKSKTPTSWTLQYLNLSGCFQITDLGVKAFTHSGRFPNLRHLDLSGCFKLTGSSLNELVGLCPSLDPQDLYYCDNILDGPWVESASGCQNTCCGRRVCCRSGE